MTPPPLDTNSRPRVLISACLLGQKVRYDGGHCATDARVHALAQLNEAATLVPICPEVVGGLGTPRPPAELIAGDGADVLRGEATLHTVEGVDVTAAFLRGAQRALALAREQNVVCAVLKARSPSCGRGQVYDGTFSGTLRAGDGVTAATLEAAGVRVFTEEQLDEVMAFLATEPALDPIKRAR